MNAILLYHELNNKDFIWGEKYFPKANPNNYLEYIRYNI